MTFSSFPPPDALCSNPNDSNSRTYKGALLEKNVDHKDCMHNKYEHLMNMANPMPRYNTQRGERIENFFGAVLRGSQCSNSTAYTNIHLYTRGDLCVAPVEAVIEIVTWL